MLWIYKSFDLEIVKVIRSAGQILKTNLLIVFLELLKHFIELFLLLGRNKLGASTQRIAHQSELR